MDLIPIGKGREGEKMEEEEKVEEEEEREELKEIKEMRFDDFSTFFKREVIKNLLTRKRQMRTRVETGDSRS